MNYFFATNETLEPDWTASPVQWMQPLRHLNSMTTSLLLSLSWKLNMRSVISLLLFGLNLSVCRALTCSSPYKAIFGVCLQLPSSKMTWCDAQAYCSSVGGELIHGTSFLMLDGKNLSGMPVQSWIGMTDFLHERNGEKSHWRWNDGAIDPSSSNLTWKNGQPHAVPHQDQDCIALRYDGTVADNRCLSSKVPMCQKRSLPNSGSRIKSFEVVPIPVGLPFKDFAENGGCSERMQDVDSVVYCSFLCVIDADDWCVAFYFNKAKKECRLVLYTDATVDMGSGEGWVKFVVTTWFNNNDSLVSITLVKKWVSNLHFNDL